MSSLLAHSLHFGTRAYSSNNSWEGSALSCSLAPQRRRPQSRTSVAEPIGRARNARTACFRNVLEIMITNLNTFMGGRMAFVYLICAAAVFSLLSGCAVGGNGQSVGGSSGSGGSSTGASAQTQAAAQGHSEDDGRPVSDRGGGDGNAAGRPARFRSASTAGRCAGQPEHGGRQPGAVAGVGLYEGNLCDG